MHDWHSYLSNDATTTPYLVYVNSKQQMSGRHVWVALPFKVMLRVADLHTCLSRPIWHIHVVKGNNAGSGPLPILGDIRFIFMKKMSQTGATPFRRRPRDKTGIHSCH